MTSIKQSEIKPRYKNSSNRGSVLTKEIDVTERSERCIIMRGFLSSYNQALHYLFKSCALLERNEELDYEIDSTMPHVPWLGRKRRKRNDEAGGEKRR